MLTKADLAEFTALAMNYVLHMEQLVAEQFEFGPELDLDCIFVDEPLDAHVLTWQANRDAIALGLGGL